MHEQAEKAQAEVVCENVRNSERAPNASHSDAGADWRCCRPWGCIPCYLIGLRRDRRCFSFSDRERVLLSVSLPGLLGVEQDVLDKGPMGALAQALSSPRHGPGAARFCCCCRGLAMRERVLEI